VSVERFWQFQCDLCGTKTEISKQYFSLQHGWKVYRPSRGQDYHYCPKCGPRIYEIAASDAVEWSTPAYEIVADRSVYRSAAFTRNGDRVKLIGASSRYVDADFTVHMRPVASRIETDK
jgi:predicted RNA-binding Zn-ribbon protein involved in translation (DUF1610 family)